MILLARLFFAFFFIALFSLGGGYNMLPLMASVLDANGWFPAADLSSLVALAESTPGPIAVNAATLVGWQTASLPGALAATAGVLAPGALLALLAAPLLARLRQSPRFALSFNLLPVVLAALLLYTAATLALPSIPAAPTPSNLLLPAAIFLLSLFLFARTALPPVLVFLLAAALALLPLP